MGADVAVHHLAEMQRDVEVGRRLVRPAPCHIQFRHLGHHRVSRAQGLGAGIGAAIEREEGEQPVAHELEHLAAFGMHGADHAVEILIKQLDEIFLRQHLGHLGEALQIGEPQHGRNAGDGAAINLP